MSSEVPVRITNRRAAVLLSDVRTATLLKPFMRRERTVSQAALEAGISLKQMHYYVTQFQTAGLLRTVREVPRRGRAVKVYLAVSRAFLLPFDVLPDSVATQALSDRFWDEEVKRGVLHGTSPVQALEVRLESRGGLSMRPVGPEHRQDPEETDLPFQLRSAGLFLTEAEARMLARELQALYDRYGQRRGHRRYGLRVDLVPIDRPVDPTG